MQFYPLSNLCLTKLSFSHNDSAIYFLGGSLLMRKGYVQLSDCEHNKIDRVLPVYHYTTTSSRLCCGGITSSAGKSERNKTVPSLRCRLRGRKLLQDSLLDKLVQMGLELIHAPSSLLLTNSNVQNNQVMLTGFIFCSFKDQL